MKTFVQPEIRIILFAVEDIVTVSGDNMGDWVGDLELPEIE